MVKLAMLLVMAMVVAVFFVPLHGKTLWDRAERRALPHAVGEVVRHTLGVSPAQQKVASAQAPTVRARAPQSGVDRIVKAPPKERLSSEDRAALDRLVDSRRR
jgi:hypothetical protein